MQTKEHKETLGSVGYNCCLDCSDGIMVFGCVESHQIAHSRYMQFLCINYTSTKLLKNCNIFSVLTAGEWDRNAPAGFLPP